MLKLAAEWGKEHVGDGEPAELPIALQSVKDLNGFGL
jgi:hypothetical protein